MISLLEARQLITGRIQPLAPQPADLASALGRVLRSAVTAPADIPAFDRSAMDGYALPLGDPAATFRVIGEVQPGEAPRVTVGAGQCVRIFTGAQLPAGATQVIMQEEVRREGDWMIPNQRSTATHIRRRGEDARQGEVLLPPGSLLGPGEISLLASLGAVNPLVSPRVRVAHFTTGNELVAPQQTPAAGQIRDSNSALVASLIQAWGGEVTRQEMLPDEFPRLQETVQQAGDHFDLLLISGGASVGDYDFGKKLLSELGFTLHFTHVNLRPGKPLVFGTRGRQAAFILPGNPVSHFVTLHVAVRAALETLAARPVTWPLVQLPLTGPVNLRADARETYWPARVLLADGRLAVQALRWQSSGDVTGLVGVNGLIRLAAGASVAPGLAEVLMLQIS